MKKLIVGIDFTNKKIFNLLTVSCSCQSDFLLIILGRFQVKLCLYSVDIMIIFFNKILIVWYSIVQLTEKWLK